MKQGMLRIKASMYSVLAVAIFFTGAAQATPDIYEKQYLGFTVWLDCDQHHGAVAFYYKIGTGTGNAKRKGSRFKSVVKLASYGYRSEG